MCIMRQYRRDPTIPRNATIVLLGLALCLLAAPPLRAGKVDAVLRTGASAELRMANGNVLPVEKMRFTTPRDLDAAEPANEPLYIFEARPRAPEFSEVRSIRLLRTERAAIGSLPDKMEVYSLGDVRYPVPPPPDWKRKFGQTPPWETAIKQDEATALPYLNEAIFCWAPPGPPRPEAGVYCFRQLFEIENAGRIVRATLRAAGNVVFRELALNEIPLHTAAPEGFDLAQYDVTGLMREGANLVALMVSQNPSRPAPGYGVAFQIEIEYAPEGVRMPRRDSGAALLAGADGDRVLGRVVSMQGGSVELETAYGRYSKQWDRADALIFPAGWLGQAETPSLGARLFGAEAPVDPIVCMPPANTLPGELQDRLLLTGARSIRGRPEYALDGRLYVQVYDGSQSSIAFEDVLGVYPPRPANQVLRRPDPLASHLYCQVFTLRGEMLTGLLRLLDAGRILLETGAGQILEFDSSEVRALNFPYHAVTSADGRAADAFALLPQAAGQEAFAPVYRANAEAVHGAVFALGGKCRDISVETLAAPQSLTPEKWPVLIGVDPLGEYFHTVSEPGDARNALLGWLERGGVMISLSCGGAMRTAVVMRGGRPSRSPVADDLASPLGLKIVWPCRKPIKSCRPFDRPPNTSEKMFFQLASGSLPKGMGALPRRIALGPMPAAPFYPMYGVEGQARTVYELQNSAGETYGPALSILPYGRGYVIVIDQLLWDSAIDGRPFAERALPSLLNSALTLAGNQ